jgi:hypothetical protein
MRGLQAAHHRQRTRLLCEEMAAAPRAPAQEPQDPGVTELLQVQRCKWEKGGKIRGAKRGTKLLMRPARLPTAQRKMYK